MRAVAELAKFASASSVVTDGKLNMTSWCENCPGYISSSRGPASREIAVSIQNFCGAFHQLPKKMEAHARKWLSAKADGVEFLITVVEKLLPQVSGFIAEKLLASLLLNQDFWKAACGHPDNFIPVADRNNVEVFQKAAIHELPQDQLACLGNMFEVGIRCEQLDTCRAEYSKAALAQNICSFLVTVYTKAWAAERPSAQELLETVMAMETAVTSLVGTLRKLESCVADEVYVRISNAVSGAIIEPLFGEMLVHLESLVAASTRNIPASYENYLIGRNCAKVKQIMFDKETHKGICGNLEAFTRLNTGFERFMADLTSLKMVPNQHLARMKSVARESGSTFSSHFLVWVHEGNPCRRL